MATWLEVKSGRGAPENKALRGPQENKGPVNPLAGVVFASDEAAELALEKGLTAGTFAGVEPTGATGYTKADVRKLAGD